MSKTEIKNHQIKSIVGHPQNNAIFTNSFLNKKYIYRFVVLALSLFFVLSILLYTRIGSSAQAAANNTINFQARILSSAGAVVPDGNYSVQFKMYDVVSGGTALWTETHSTVLVKSGYVSVPLGSITAFPGSVQWDQELWLTMNVNSDGEMNPRMKVTSVPFAQAAAKLQQTNGSFTSNLSLVAPTGGNQNFFIPDQGANGNYNLCIQNSSACGFALSSGSGSYIQNQNALQQAASNFWISGTGRADTSILSPVVNGSTSANGTLTIRGNSSATGNTLTSPNIQFRVGDNGGTTAMTVLNNGNVGIGTTSPSSQLQVNAGAATTIGAIIRGAALQTVDLLQLQNNAGTVLSKFDSAGRLYVAGGSVSSPSFSFVSDTDTGIYNAAADSIAISTGGAITTSFRNNGSARSTNLFGSTYNSSVANSILNINASGSVIATHSIDDVNKRYLIQPYEPGVGYNVNTILNSIGGRVGIGTSTPSAQLEIIPTLSTYVGQIIRGASSQTGDLMQILNGDNKLFIVKAGGNIGIGTDNPTENLQIVSASPTIKLQNNTGTSSNNSGTLLLQQQNNTGVQIRYEGDTDVFAIRTLGDGSQNGGVFVITNVDANNVGRVGIGTTSPSSLLSVGSTSQFQVNSSGAIAAVTGITSSGGYTQSGTSANTFTGATTFSATGTALNVTNNATVGGALNIGSDVSLSRGATNRLDLASGDSLNLVSGNLQQGAVNRLTSNGLFQAANGAMGGPAYSFSGDTDTGIYNIAADTLGLATNGAERLRVSNSGTQINGTLTISSVASGNVNSKIGNNTSWSAIMPTTGLWPTDGSQRAVGYIEINSTGAYLATMDISISGGWASGAIMGRITKSVSFYHAALGTTVTIVDTRVKEAYGAITNNYAIGEPEVVNQKVRIPIYRLNTSTTTPFSVDISTYNSSADVQNNLTIVNPVLGSNSAVANIAADSSNSFIQNGNTFGTTAILGTNDAQSFVLETNNVARLTVDSSGSSTFTGTLSVGGATTLSSTLQVNGNTTLGDAATDITTVRGLTTLTDSSDTYPLRFGADVNLYRGATNRLDLATGDSLNLVSGNLQVGATTVISSGRAIQNATGITSSGTITLSGLTADRLVVTTTGGQLTNSITSSNLLASVSGTTGTGNLVFSNSPTFVSSITSPIIYGSSIANGTLILQGNSAISGNTATNSAIQMLVGNSGAINAITILNNGNVAIGKNNPNATLDINVSAASAGKALMFSGTSAFPNTDNNNGPVYILSYNGSGNRQVTLFDSSQLADSSKFGFRYIVGSGLPIIDAVSTNLSTLGNFNLSTGTSRVGIGFPFNAEQTDVGALLHVSNSVSGRTATIIRGATNQTADLLQIQNSSGIVLAEFDSTGKLGIGVNNPTSSLVVRGTNSIASVATSNLLTADGTFDSNSGWTANTGWTIGSGVVSHATGNTDVLSGTTTATAVTTVYQVNFTVTQTTAGAGFGVSLGGNDSGTTISTAGAKTLYIRPSNTTGTLTFTPLGTGTWVGTIDDVTIYAVTASTADMAIQGSNGALTPLEVRQGGSNLSNLFMGTGSGTNNIAGTTGNVGIGSQSMLYNATGVSNVAVGYRALYLNTTGSNNVGVGFTALQSNISGSGNTAVGFNSMSSNTAGNNNTALGFQSLLSNTTGSSNTAIGYRAMYLNTTGVQNTALGFQSLNSNTTGSNNVAVGYFSLLNLIGTGNTAIGINSGRLIGSGANLTSATNSIFIGFGASASDNANTNEIVIGTSAVGNGSNSVTIGHTNITKTILRGDLGLGTASPTSILHSVASGAKTTSYTGNLLTNTATSSTASINKIGLDVQSTGTWNGSGSTNTGLNVSVSGGAVNYAATFQGGNVGIGTNTPSTELEVVGDITSTGTKWTSRTSAADNEWLSVTYGNGIFVAVAKSGSGNRVMTSPDGINWTARAAAVDNEWLSVTFGNGLFVAVAQTGTGNRVMISSNGINWTVMPTPSDINWRSITYGNGRFVAVASSSSGVMTSEDGKKWTLRTAANANSWVSVTYGNGLFVAVAYTGSGNRVMTSPDGINWTAQTSAADNSWWSVTYGNGLFVAVANSGSGNRVMTSPDGINWTARTSAADNNWNSVVYGDGIFVAVSESGSGNRVMTSPDGINWTLRSSTANNSWHGVTYANGIFVAVGYSGSGNRVMTSGKATLISNNNDNILLGNVGIGNNSPNFLLHVGSADVGTGGNVAQFQNAGGTCTITPSTSGGITCTSDIRNKKNINGYDSKTALDQIIGLKTISYNMNSDPEGYLKKVGFSAQDLETILPDLVVTDSDGYKSISYSGLTPYLVSAIQEQQSQINDAKTRLSELENSIQPSSNMLDLTYGGTIQGTLNVIGNINTNGSLTVLDLMVTNNVNIGGKLTVNEIAVQNITINGKIITVGDKPVVTLASPAGVADSENSILGPSASIEGNDTSGTITIIPGKNTEAGEIAKIDFVSDFSTKPRIVISPANQDSVKVGVYHEVSQVENSGFSIYVNQAMETGKTYSFTYFIVQ